MSREISQGSNVTLFDRVSLKDVPLEFFSNLIQPYRMLRKTISVLIQKKGSFSALFGAAKIPFF
jgi:hypothetical protein